MSATAENPTPAWLAAGSALTAPAEVSDPTLGPDLVGHLDRQLDSVRRMRRIVFAQAAAIRRRAVRDVVATTGELQVEMHRRELLERERMGLMARAARGLAMAPEAVGFTSVQRLMDPATAELTAAATAELTALLKEVDREHTLNRRLLAQELAFLDHLLGMADGTGGYAARPARVSAAGTGAPAPRVRRNVSVNRRRMFDLEA